MASTYTPLGVELQATGENAGTWGTKTNTNLQIIEQISGGFTAVNFGSDADIALSVSDGSTGAALAHRVLEFTSSGSLTATRNCTIPLDVQQFYILKNSTTGSQSITFKYVSGSGNSVTVENGSTVIAYAKANDGTNPDIDSAVIGDVTLTGAQTLTNKTLTAPKIADAGFIADANGNEQVIFQTTSSAVNEVEITNAATGNGPIIGASGETNVDLNLNPKGSGTLKSGSSAVKIAGKETIWVPAVAMYPNTTNGAEAAQVELSNGPEIKVLDFDKTSDEFAQFAVAFPKSWNEGTVTFQAFFTATSTNTGTTAFVLQGVALADNGDLNTAFGTAVGPTAKAHSGTSNDLDVTAESGAVTIAGSPGVDEYVFFQISRDVSADDLDADARLLGIKLFFTTSAANDA